MSKLSKEQREEALKKVAEVLEEAMAEYEMLEKMDLELAEDPSRPFPAAAASDEAAPEEEDEDKDKEDSEEEADEDKEGDEDEEEMSDDAMKSEFAAMQSKMQSRGLLKKEDTKIEEVKKSETAPAATQGEDLKKAIDDRFESLTKTIAEIAAQVNKIASAPAPRKGAAGYAPLKKNEEGSEEAPLNKSEVITKLLDLKKSGKEVPTALFARIETGRHTDQDIKFIKGILG